MKKIFLNFAIVFGSTLGGYAQTYQVNKIGTNIIIDGDLSEWTTPFIGPFVQHNNGNPATQNTSVSLAWNYDALYLAYNISDISITGSVKVHDSPIYDTDDLVEIFIDPDGDTKNYAEIGINAFASYYDNIMLCATPDCGGKISDFSWDAQDIQTAAIRTSEGYTVEIKIPFANLATIPNGAFSTPTIGTTWKGNVFRIDYGPGEEYLAISAYPSGNMGFHQPTQFKTLEFVDDLTEVNEEHHAACIQIVPNPSSTNIEAKGAAIVAITLLSADGQTYPLTAISNTFSIQHIPAGIYMACMKSKDGVFYQKVIKQ
jgi:hypothetical protein